LQAGLLIADLKGRSDWPAQKGITRTCLTRANQALLPASWPQQRRTGVTRTATSVATTSTVNNFGSQSAGSQKRGPFEESEHKFVV
jgi:hypothetical protein